MRALASIKIIDEIQPIPQADLIEKVRVDGWWIVVKKGEFKPHDICVYHEIDSFVPVLPRYNFLERGSKPKKMIVDGKEVEGYRIKTVVLRKQVSQGLVLPLSLFPELGSPEVGTDVTEKLGIRLYEAPVPAELSGEVVGAFPGYIPKTDEERVQSRPELLEELKGKSFYSSVKIDGTSTTISKYRGDFFVCGHNLNFRENEKSTFWRLANHYDLRNKLPEGYAIQGECAGEGIQANRQKLKGQDIFVFYVFEIERYRYLELEEMEEFCSKLGLKMVPIANRNLILNHTMEDLLKIADGPCPLNPNELQEGLVFRQRGAEHKTSFKVISNQYLIKHGL